MNKKKIGKIALIILSIVVVVVIIIMTTTQALFTKEQVAANPNDYTTGTLSITASSKSDTLSLTSALPMTDDAGIETEPYIFTVKNTGNVAYKFNIALETTSTNTFSNQYIKLQVDDEIMTLPSDGIIKKDVYLQGGTSIDISIRVWLDIDTPNTEIGKSFSANVVINGESTYKKENLATKITSLYSPNKTAENNSITYNLDDNNKLMKDVAGNIRYYGAEPKNYIKFNCETYPSNDCETWRIIGIVDGKVKLIRNESIGNLAYDQNKNIDSSVTTYTSQWVDENLNSTSINNSSLQLLLNGAYYNGDTAGTVTYYSGATGETSTDLDMASIGIKNKKTRDLISESTWYLRGINTSLYPDGAYDYERISGTMPNNTYPTSWDGNIALAYPSDYGYAVDLSLCQNKKITAYYDTTCVSNNWLKILIGSNGYGTLLTPFSSYGIHVVYNGGVFYILNQMPAYVIRTFAINPTLYLDPNASIVSGDGSEGSPYLISAD